MKHFIHRECFKKDSFSNHLKNSRAVRKHYRRKNLFYYQQLWLQKNAHYWKYIPLFPVLCSYLVWLFMFIKVFKWSWSPGITWYWAEAEGSKYFLLIKLNLATLTCCLPACWWLTLYQHWQWIFTLHNAFNFLMSTGSLVCVKLVSIISDTRQDAFIILELLQNNELILNIETKIESSSVAYD